MNANSDPAPEAFDRLDKDHGDEVPPPSGLDAIPVDHKAAGKPDKEPLI